MRIIQINSHFKKSGAGKIVADIHEELLKKGHSSFVICGRGDKVKNSNVFQISNDKSISVLFSVFVMRVIGLEGYTNYIATLKAIKFIDYINPDVIHLHGLHSYYLNYRKLFNYINKKNIPCVWTFHDMMAISGNCGYSYECDKYISGCYNCKYLKSYPKSLFFDLTKIMWNRKFKLFTKNENMIIVGPSEWITNIAKKSFLNMRKCITINNGINTENIFYRREKDNIRLKKGYSSEDKIILSIASGIGDPRKGVKYIIELAKSLSEQYYKFILIGWSNKNNDMIKDLKNIKTISFTKDQDELAEYYSMADVFIAPSIAENYATTIIESLACGTPVVGFDVGGIPEQIKGKKGILVPLRSQKDLCQAVKDILNKKADILSSYNISENIKNNNSIKKMTNSYTKVYEILQNIKREGNVL